MKQSPEGGVCLDQVSVDVLRHNGSLQTLLRKPQHCVMGLARGRGTLELLVPWEVPTSQLLCYALSSDLGTSKLVRRSDLAMKKIVLEVYRPSSLLK
jgi:hypothetical protein